jgi:hypothetical protein
VKQDSIKTSLDFLSSQDYDSMAQIFETLDFITEIELYSEKCGKKELQKLEDDYAKDLKKDSKKTKANLWRYIAEDKPDSDDEGAKKGEGAKVQEMSDSTVS